MLSTLPENSTPNGGPGIESLIINVVKPVVEHHHALTVFATSGLGCR